MTDFVVRVEQELMERRNAERMVLLEKLQMIREQIPAGAFETTPAEAGVSTRVANLLDEAGYENAGQVLEQLELDSDKILGLQGIGPKAIAELGKILPAYQYPEPVVEDEPDMEEEAPADLEEPETSEVAADDEPETEESPADAEIEAAEPAEETAEEEPQAIPIEEAFERAIEAVGVVAFEEEAEEEIPGETEAERKKRKERSRIVEYDPDLGETVVRHRRKASRQAGWEETGNYEEPEG